ncbi:hypothetical protein PVAG01_03820 [Phlyctema vagabunda]|uniref:CCHC-type domain-containing protein n=1 Tax=Phlyctema vagabunda TaxID=108571 RepID=A0ABR4PMI6_9HELO
MENDDSKANSPETDQPVSASPIPPPDSTQLQAKYPSSGSQSICGNCQHHGHVLKECRGPVDIDGAIAGCPKCNTRAHYFDDCPKADMSERMYFQVWTRLDKAPIASGRDWTRLYLLLDASSPATWPWTLQYSRQMMESRKVYVTSADPYWKTHQYPGAAGIESQAHPRLIRIMFEHQDNLRLVRTLGTVIHGTPFTNFNYNFPPQYLSDTSEATARNRSNYNVNGLILENDFSWMWLKESNALLHIVRAGSTEAEWDKLIQRGHAIVHEVTAPRSTTEYQLSPKIEDL